MSKQIIRLLLCMCFLFSSAISVRAEENYENNDNEETVIFVEQRFDFKAECGVQETTNHTQLMSNKPEDPIRKFVTWFITVTSAQVAGNIGEDVLNSTIKVCGYLWSNEPDYTVVQQWAAQYNATSNDFIATHGSTEYDTGCWTPAFPANPFCRMRKQ